MKTNQLRFFYISFFLLTALVGRSYAAGSGNHGHGDPDGGHHKHANWVSAPAEYQGKSTNTWSDASAAQRGKALFNKNCASCHGVDGKGKGPIAKNLPHAPADLTNHFHMAPGKGDDYLFWRISEGGIVEPFKSMLSTMPPFKSSLNEDERWDVLIYVHNQFHKGFKQQQGHGKGHSDIHEHGQHGH